MQGDGCAFEGTWDFAKFMEAQTDLGADVRKIEAIGFTVSACRITHHGNYMYEYTFDVELKLSEKDDTETWWGRLSPACREPLREEAESLCNTLQAAVLERLRDIARACYRCASDAILYQSSDNALMEEAEGNDWEFTEDGDFDE